MVATCNILGETIVLGTLQTISYSLHMDRRAIRSIGNVNAKDYTQGPRTIAGSLVFAVFDKHMLYHMAEQFALNNNTYKENAYTVLYDKYKSFTQNRHILSDELPPFDVTVTCANEYGNRAKLAIYGIQLLNEGQVMSINDIYTENTYQFVALDIDYLRNDDPVYNYEEPVEEIEPTVPNINVSKEYDDETTLSLAHINHDYLNSTSLLRITKISVDDNAKINDGILYIKTENGKNEPYREYEIPASNSNIYNKTLRLENGVYKAYFKENTTNLQTDEILIYIHDEDRGYRPIIENTLFSDFAKDVIYPTTFYFKVRSLCASLYGHNKLYIRNATTNNTEIYDINDYGYTLVPVSSFIYNNDYIIYSGKQVGTSESFEEQSISHLFKFSIPVDFSKYTTQTENPIYNDLINESDKLIFENIIEAPNNQYKDSPYSAQAYLLNDYLINRAFTQDEINHFIENVYMTEYNILTRLNGLDNISKADNAFCVNKIIESYNNNIPYSVSVNDSIDFYNDKPDKYITKYSVYYYYDINREKNDICSCLKIKLIDRRNSSEHD